MVISKEGSRWKLNFNLKEYVPNKFVGGCSGNTQGVAALAKGMKVTDIVERLQGIRCGSKPTSCPDQLAKALIKHAM